MSEIRATTISDQIGTGPVTLTGQSAAKAWSNLNGTGTIAERDSFNISGYVDNGTGQYTFTISSDMSDANYSTAVNTGRSGGSEYVTGYPATVPAAGSFKQTTLITSGSAFSDYEAIALNFFGDLA